MNNITIFIDKLDKVNKQLNRLKSFLDKRGNDILEKRYHKLYMEKKLILKHLELEIN